MTDDANTNVEYLTLVDPGEHFRMDPDVVLEGAKGRKYKRLLIIGELEEPDEDGEDLFLSGNANIGESLILIELFKRTVI
ncbi:hypothetical protein [Brevundimonas sp. NPDC058933]|uniref:hypothetical protein n=1 Tax=Brevundimonas sp. NPDC058933 TaxID=3346673 RepID=UPI003BEF1D93